MKALLNNKVGGTAASPSPLDEQAFFQISCTGYGENYSYVQMQIPLRIFKGRKSWIISPSNGHSSLAVPTFYVGNTAVKTYAWNTMNNVDDDIIPDDGSGYLMARYRGVGSKAVTITITIYN